MYIFDNSAINPAAFGRFLLDKFPIFDYVDLKQHINIAILGDAEPRTDFFKMAASCCHMIGKELTITLAAPAAHSFMLRFLEENPMSQTAFSIRRISLNGGIDTIPYHPTSKAVNDPLVSINIITDDLNAPEKFAAIDSIACPSHSSSLFSYAWVMYPDSAQNTVTGKLLEKYMDQSDFFKAKKEGPSRSFIGELNTGKGQAVERIATKKRITHLIVNVNMAEQEAVSFEKELLEKAFSVHRFYAKEYNSRQPIKAMREDFSKAYAKASSIRSAISIPYKIASVIPYYSRKGGKTVQDAAMDVRGTFTLGAKEFDRETVKEFAKIVTGEKNQDKGREKLVYLEHKSWMVWLICNGWQRARMDEIRSYAFIGGNDFKDKKKKRHPCLVECLPEGKMYLDDGAKITWGRSYLNEIKDPLDKVSLELYLYAKERTQELCIEGGEVDRLAGKLSGILETSKGTAAGHLAQEISVHIRNLKNAFRKLAEEERNAANHFDRCVKEFRQVFAKGLEEDQSLENALEELVSLAAIAKEAARHRSYKRSDLTLLQAIPSILNTGKTPCIYKLESKEKPWENMYSSVLIEPQKTVILCDDFDSGAPIEEQGKYKEVLEGMGLGHITCVTVGACMAAKNRMLAKATEQDIVDITGAEPSFAYRVRNMPEFAKCQFIVVKDGEVINLTQEEKQGYLYPVQKSLTVGETLRLSDVYYYTERDANTLASFANTYRDIWKLYFNMDAISWKKLCAFVWYADQKNKKAIDMSSESKVLAQYTAPVPRKALEISNVEQALGELKAAGLIVSYQIPRDEKVVKLEIQTKYHKMMDSINWMLDRAQQGWEHDFKYIKQKAGYKEEISFLYDDIEELHLDEKEDIPLKLSNGLENEFGGHSYDEIRRVINRILNANQGMTGKCILRKANTQQGIAVSLKSTAVKRLLEREGNALEQFTYFTMRSLAFDDVKLSVSLAFAAPDDFQDPDTDTTNEIDVIATKGMESYFVSCKQGWAKKEYLTEIKYFAEHLGVRGKAILICSHKGEEKFQAVRRRADIMGVYFITCSVIRQGKLGEALERIRNGADVKEINHMCGL